MKNMIEQAMDKTNRENARIQEEMKELVGGDKRAPLNGWAPGTYQSTCYRCEEFYTGSKHSIECSSCAYDDVRRF